MKKPQSKTSKGSKIKVLSNNCRNKTVLTVRLKFSNCEVRSQVQFWHLWGFHTSLTCMCHETSDFSFLIFLKKNNKLQYCAFGIFQTCLALWMDKISNCLFMCTLCCDSHLVERPVRGGHFYSFTESVKQKSSGGIFIKGLKWQDTKNSSGGAFLTVCALFSCNSSPTAFLFEIFALDLNFFILYSALKVSVSKEDYK